MVLKYLLSGFVLLCQIELLWMHEVAVDAVGTVGLALFRCHWLYLIDRFHVYLPALVISSCL